MTNPAIDFQKYREVYQQKGFAVIPDILEEHYAEFIEAEFQAISHTEWVNIVGDPNRGADYKKPGWSEEFIYEKDAALGAYRYGNLCHSYKRYDIISNFKYATFVLSSDFKSILNTISGEKCTLFSRNGVYRHVENDFIVRHTYGLVNSVGYVLNVTKGWEADYGGLLIFQDIFSKEIVLVEPGRFNTLIVFDTDRIQNMHRSFSRVNVCENFLSRVYIEGALTKLTS